MTRTFQPLGDRILIKPVEQEEVSKGGLVLPDTARERPQEGEVIAAGPGRLTEEGNRIPLEAQRRRQGSVREVRGNRAQGRR